MLLQYTESLHISQDLQALFSFKCHRPLLSLKLCNIHDGGYDVKEGWYAIGIVFMCVCVCVWGGGGSKRTGQSQLVQPCVRASFRDV
jgi:hypothetical protein